MPVSPNSTRPIAGRPDSISESAFPYGGCSCEKSTLSPNELLSIRDNQIFL